MNFLSKINKIIGHLVGFEEDHSKVIEDLSELKRSYQADKLYGTYIWKQVPDAIAISNEDGIVVDCNDAYLKLYETSYKNVINQPFYIIFPEEVHEQANLKHKEVFKSELQCQTYESWITTLKGKNLFVESVVEFIYNNNEKLLISTIRDQTEKKQVELNLQKLTQQNDLIIESANLGTWFTDSSKNEFIINDIWANNYGYEKHEIDNPYEFFIDNLHPHSLEEIQIFLQDASNNNNEFSLEIRIKHKNKFWKWIFAKGQILTRLKNGKINKMSGIHLDIHDRKTTELELEESRARYEFLFESMPQILWTANIDGEITYVNKFGLNYFGASLNEINSDKWLSFIHDDDKEQMIQKWKKSLLTGEEFSNYQRMQNSKHVYNWFAVNAYKFNFDKKVTWFGISRNINERYELTSKLENIATHSNEVFNIFNKNKYIYTTPNIKNVLGYTVEELADQEFFLSRVHPDEKEIMNEFYIKLKKRELKNGDLINYKFRKSNDELVWLEISVSTSKDKTNKDLLILTTRDVTERVQNNLKLEELNTFNSQIISMLSHDLTNSIGSVMGLTEVMLTDKSYVLNDDTKYIMTKINESISSSYEMLNNVLNWAKNTRGSNAIYKSNINITQILDKLCNFFKIKIESKNINIIINVPDNINIYSDKTIVETILRNILSNAIKYSNENSKVLINLLENNNDYLAISIKDCGPGISNEYLDKILDIDYNRNYINNVSNKGSGLGLKIVLEFLEIIDGEIKIESEEGKGTNVILKFTK